MEILRYYTNDRTFFSIAVQAKTPHTGPMSRTIGSNGPKTMAAIRAAGLALIYRHGYAAMSLRQLAAEVGIQPGSLYNHISTKQDLLLTLLQTHMEALLKALDEALAPAQTPESQLRAFVRFHVNYHIARKQEVFICYSELRSLNAANYDIIVSLRAAYERRLMRILADGNTEAAFDVQDIPATSYALLAMLTGICTWYDPEGRLSAEELVAHYIKLTLSAVAAEKRCAPIRRI